MSNFEARCLGSDNACVTNATSGDLTALHYPDYLSARDALLGLQAAAQGPALPPVPAQADEPGAAAGPVPPTSGNSPPGGSLEERGLHFLGALMPVQLQALLFGVCAVLPASACGQPGGLCGAEAGVCPEGRQQCQAG